MLRATDEDIGVNSETSFHFVTDVDDLDGYKYFTMTTSEPNSVTIRQDTTFDRENKAKQYKVSVFIHIVISRED